ncbi:unnamed protein product [Diamesa tonsa]
MAIQLKQFRIHQLFATCFPPGLIIIVWLFDLIILSTVKLLLIGWFAVFIILPLIFKFSYSIQRGVLFLTFISYPPNLDLGKPETLGLYATRHFYIKYDDTEENVGTVKLGVWHCLPTHIAKRFAKQLHVSDDTVKNITTDKLYNNTRYNSMVDETSYNLIETEIGQNYDESDPMQKQLLFEEILRRTKDPIVLYLHGNTGSRGNGHRVELYKILRRLGYHVIAVDYRGYADSSDIPPTEVGAVNDALMTYKYIKNLTNNAVFVYGHSLGTGIGAHMLSILNKTNIPGPKAVILESPFNNMKDEITVHPFSWLYRHLPWFNYTILKPIHDNGFRFESDQHIAEFRAPVLILHAEDDRVVPFHLGYALYRSALETRQKSWGPVQFHRFDGNGKYGHKFIVHAKNFSTIIQLFFDTYQNETY